MDAKIAVKINGFYAEDVIFLRLRQEAIFFVSRLILKRHTEKNLFIQRVSMLLETFTDAYRLFLLRVAYSYITEKIIKATATKEDVLNAESIRLELRSYIRPGEQGVLLDRLSDYLVKSPDSPDIKNILFKNTFIDKMISDLQEFDIGETEKISNQA